MKRTAKNPKQKAARRVITRNLKRSLNFARLLPREMAISADPNNFRRNSQPVLSFYAGYACALSHFYQYLGMEDKTGFWKVLNEEIMKQCGPGGSEEVRH
jgi:hypothetical protein